VNNLELKARISSVEAAVKTAERLAGVCHADIHQTDTYFKVHEGRLKLREYEDTAELIFYNRPDSRDPKYSTYYISEVSNPFVFNTVLGNNLGVKAIVKKRRRVFLLENTRIHIDEAEGLGDFLEFEVVFGEDTTPDGARKMVALLMDEFDIKDEDLVGRSYCDLLEGTEA